MGTAVTIGRRQLLQAALAATLPFGLLACGRKEGPLQVGGLPVTCNLTLPVACMARDAANRAAAPGAPGFHYEYSKFNGWPEIKESLMTGRIQAAYMLAPLVMDLADKKIPVKIVSLGHRSGAVIMVRTESPYQHFKQLAGKRIAIPSRFAVDFLFLRKMLTVREELIASNPALVQDLVNHVLGAGVWLDAQQGNRDKAVAIAAGRQFFNQDPKILKFVMENPTDRVTYGDLRMIRAEFDELMQLSVEAGTIKHPIAYETYVDETFARRASAAQIAL